MSSSIGFRCRDSSLLFVVVSGSLEDPLLTVHSEWKLPAGAERAEGLRAMRLMVHSLLDEHLPDSVGFRAPELARPGGSALRQADFHRAEFEGVLQEAAYSHSLRLAPVRWVSSSLKSRLGVPVKEKLERAASMEPMTRVAMPKKYLDAAYVAVAQLA